MVRTPTHHHLLVLHSVEQSSAGIDAIPDKTLGLDCVRYGWLKHHEHRRDEGGVTDIWVLTGEGREILVRSTPDIREMPG